MHCKQYTRGHYASSSLSRPQKAFKCQYELHTPPKSTWEGYGRSVAAGWNRSHFANHEPDPVQDCLEDPWKLSISQLQLNGTYHHSAVMALTSLHLLCSVLSHRSIKYKWSQAAFHHSMHKQTKHITRYMGLKTHITVCGSEKST